MAEQMKISQLLKAKGGSLSFEFFPPRDAAGEDRLFTHVVRLETLNPTFVSVTYGAGGGTLKNTGNVVLRIQRETSLIAMPHLTCVDQNKRELKSILGDYSLHGINNILALRGDPPRGVEKFVLPKDGFCYARDLVKLAASVSDFSIGVAAYPEGHCESPSLEADMLYLKQKIDAGADFAITQMFFDNHYFYDFMERTEKAGIKVPIIAGIMPITDIKRITGFSKKCSVTIPERLLQKFVKIGISSEEIEEIGADIAIEQCADLLKNGVSYFHFYTLNTSELTFRVITSLNLQNLGLPKWDVS